MSDPTVSNLILRQLGGQAFLAMTGARDITYDSRGVTMRLPKAGRPGVGYVRVTLTDLDLYEIATMSRRGRDAEIRDDIPVENLSRVFEDLTGLRVGL